MIDVFWCSAPQSEERAEIALRTFDYWKQQSGVRLKVLSPKIIQCSPFDFQKERRRVAEHIAVGPYILADDDCLPLSDWSVALDALLWNPDFAILSAWPVNAAITRWTPEGYTPYWDLKIEEHVDVGGLRMIRKGAMFTAWPEQTKPSYDREHCEALRACGYRVGYSQHWRMEHLGEGKSQIWAFA